MRAAGGALAVDHREQIEDPVRLIDAGPGVVPGPVVALPPQIVPWTQRALHRGVDLSVAVVLLVLVAIPMVLIACMVKATSPGPVLFRHERVGRDGRTFRIAKFRTMVDGTNAEVLADARQRRAYQENDFKLHPDDPRITPLGRFLRSSSLDELPQLFNVVTGQMSIVGVRPLLPEELALRPVVDQALYRRFRPGMTGLWQVEGRSSVQCEARHALDRRHLEQWSFGTNMRILVRTPLAVVREPKAY